jgi:hypothetical protein
MAPLAPLARWESKGHKVQKGPKAYKGILDPKVLPVPPVMKDRKAFKEQPDLKATKVP